MPSQMGGHPGRSLGRLAVYPLLLACMSSTWGALNVSGIQVSDTLLAFALALVALQICQNKCQWRIPGWLWVAPAAVVSVMCFRFLFEVSNGYMNSRLTAGLNLSSNMKALFWVIALILLPVVIIAATAEDRRTPRLVMLAFIVGAAVSAGVAVVDFLGFTNIAESLLGYRNITARQNGLALHPNTLGFAATLAVPMAAYFLGLQIRARGVWFFSVVLVLLGCGVALSGSRGAQAAFVLALLASVLLANGRVRGTIARRIGTVGLISFAAFYMLSSYIPDSARLELFRFAGHASNVADSNADRLSLASQAISDFNSYPIFGIGISYITAAHSIYLQLLSAGGLVLVFGMGAYWIFALRSGLILLRYKVGLALPLVISVVLWLAMGLVENQLTDRFLYYPVGCIAALYSMRPYRKSSDVVLNDLDRVVAAASPRGSGRMVGAEADARVS
ncbi:O-antigen ligase family protein [Prescottella equi]|uniref:O-antigen ligase family protein n=1 Tax=Rhodococcus hoagii TaxID=43767 RepID=UPI000A0F9A65|nr:O-antigen ligase family protein [Prescottella equi]